MIRLYKPNGMIGVDGIHKNLAFLQKKRLQMDSPRDFSTYAVFDYGEGVPVFLLEEGKSVNLYGTWSNGSQTVVYGGRDADCYFFGFPAQADTSTRVGMKIYSETTHELIFDSRLKYLKIVGLCQPNMQLDVNKTYGILCVNVAKVIGYNGNTSYVPDYEIGEEYVWKRANNQLLYQFYSYQFSGARNQTTYNHGMPPLLVDLTGL